MKTGKVGKFQIETELGQGAMGHVYRALDPILDRHVALKIIPPAVLNTKEALVRFRREAKNAARLTHPNIVTIYEVPEGDDVGGTHYIAMELVEGMELAEAMTPPDRLSVEQKVRLVVEVCRGLDFAHRMGVIHRDVKPANIRLTRDGTVKILDFGIAKSLRADSTDPNLTQQGLVLGTPSYLSPELVQGAKVDHHADMWAVGVILYEMLAGRRPFEAPTITSLVHRIVNQPPPPLDAKALHIPEALAAVAMRALDKDRSRRFRDLGEMANALLIAIGATPAPEVPLAPEVRRRAYEANFAEARRLLTEDDLSGALEAARRAQTLDNTRTGIVSLIRVIEERLLSATTVRKRPSAGSEATRTALASPARTLTAEATLPALAVPPGPLDTATLRARGAGAFREAGTFGEPPATKEAVLSPVVDVLAVAGADGAIRLWDLRSRNRASVLRTDLHRRSGHDAAALCLAFSPDGSLLASAHVDGVVHLWDMAKAEEVPVRLRHDESVGTLAFSPDGATLATGSLDANLRLWDVGAALAGEARRELVRQPAGVTALAWAGGGEWILTGHSSRVLRLLDPHRSRLLATMRGPEGLVNLLTLSPDGRFMAVASQDRTVRLFDLATRQESNALTGLRRPATSMCFLGDGGFLGTVCQDNAVQLWDLETGSPGATLWGPADESFVGLALFGESNHLAVALADGRIRVWGPAA